MEQTTHYEDDSSENKSMAELESNTETGEKIFKKRTNSHSK